MMLDFSSYLTVIVTLVNGCYMMQPCKISDQVLIFIIVSSTYGLPYALTGVYPVVCNVVFGKTEVVPRAMRLNPNLCLCHVLKRVLS
jgi:hypothetical protein